jgi:hypothetical protein
VCGSERSVSLCRCVAVSLCRCVAVLLCVALRCIGRSLRQSATVFAQQRWRCSAVLRAAVVLSHDTSGCSCILVALAPPSDAVLACWCVSTPVMREAVCLLYVSAVKRHRVAGLHVCHSRHSLAVCSRCCCCCVPSACLHVHGVVCRVVTCATVAVSLRHRVG